METFVVKLTSIAGRRHAVRRMLKVPWELAVGEYEDLSDRALNDAIKDLWHEQRRRLGLPLGQPSPHWNPYATQITNPEETA